MNALTNRITQRFLLVSTVALIAGASATAMARGPGCDGPGFDGPGAGRAPTEQMKARMGQQMAKRQAALKEKLKLTPEQEPAWAAFTGAMQPPANPSARPDPAEMAKLTTPQRLERMQALRAEHDAQMTKRLDATKAFYAALTPEQQKVFDTETAHGPRMGQGKGHEGHRGFGPGRS